MKKALWLLIAAIGFTGGLKAQEQQMEKWGEDSVKCRENLYIYYELARSKNYLEAYDSWKYVIDHCPASSKNNVIYGPYIVEAKLKEATTEEEKMKYKNMLMDVYDIRLQLFPGKEAYVMERKALDMIQHFPDSTKKAYDLFKKAVELDKDHSAAFYNGYFIGAARLFNDDVFSIGDVFNAYNVVMEGIEYNTNKLNEEITEIKDKQDSTTSTLSQKEEQALAKAERELGRYDDVESNIEKILGPIATCDKLADIYNEESFQANKKDPTWLRRAAKMLSRERENDEGEEVNCTDNPIFIKVAEALYKQEPSPTSARAISIIAARNKDYSKAIQYLNEAIDLEVDRKKKASDYLRIASYNLQIGRAAAAKGSAQKAANLRSGWGRPYIIIAQSYAAGKDACGDNACTKGAVYWAAIDKLNYAKSIDASVASTANRLIAAYKQQLPQKSICFQLGFTQGQKIKIGCYINETVTVDFN